MSTKEYESYYVIGFNNDETAKKYRELLCKELMLDETTKQPNVFFLGAYTSKNDIINNLSDDME